MTMNHEPAKAIAAAGAGAAAGYGAIATSGLSAASVVSAGTGVGAVTGPLGATVGALVGLSVYGIYRALQG